MNMIVYYTSRLCTIRLRNFIFFLFQINSELCGVLGKRDLNLERKLHTQLCLWIFKTRKKTSASTVEK